MTPDQFRDACLSLKGYKSVIGCFGGCPTVSKYFDDYCQIMQELVPFEQRGLWCNNLMGKGAICRKTFNPSVSNLNCHMDKAAYDEFKRDWPESNPFGLESDSRHAPPFVSMRDLNIPESKRWELISQCPINIHWSSLIGVFRGQVRAWFCEIAGSQSILHQHEEDYPDTGLPIEAPYLYEYDGKELPWWQLPMTAFREQVQKHCHSCGIPLKGYGELALAVDGKEQVSKEHEAVYKPKRAGRRVELITVPEQLHSKGLLVTDYIGGARK
jgi:hypothetical protein